MVRSFLMALCLAAACSGTVGSLGNAGQPSGTPDSGSSLKDAGGAAPSDADVTDAGGTRRWPRVTIIVATGKMGRPRQWRLRSKGVAAGAAVAGLRALAVCSAGEAMFDAGALTKRFAASARLLKRAQPFCSRSSWPMVTVPSFAVANVHPEVALAEQPRFRAPATPRFADDESAVAGNGFGSSRC